MFPQNRAMQRWIAPIIRYNSSIKMARYLGLAIGICCPSYPWPYRTQVPKLQSLTIHLYIKRKTQPTQVIGLWNKVCVNNGRKQTMIPEALSIIASWAPAAPFNCKSILTKNCITDHKYLFLSCHHIQCCLGKSLTGKESLPFRR